MTDLTEQEIVVDRKGNHHRFISVENSEAEANVVCEKLSDMGYSAGTSQRADNGLWEVFQQFSPAEECLYILEKPCTDCKKKSTDECNTRECTTKSEIEDVIWKDSIGFHRLVRYKLKKLRAANAKPC